MSDDNGHVPIRVYVDMRFTEAQRAIELAAKGQEARQTGKLWLFGAVLAILNLMLTMAGLYFMAR